MNKRTSIIDDDNIPLIDVQSSTEGTVRFIIPYHYSVYMKKKLILISFLFLSFHALMYEMYNIRFILLQNCSFYAIFIYKKEKIIIFYILCVTETLFTSCLMIQPFQISQSWFQFQRGGLNQPQ